MKPYIARRWHHWGILTVMVQTSLCAVAAQPTELVLDTLLYTPAQRQEMGYARLPRSGGSSIISSTYLQGVVRRGDGKGTVWLNGKALPQGAPDTPIIQGVDAVVNGKQLRVGESLDPLSGARSDVVAPGAVTKRITK